MALFLIITCAFAAAMLVISGMRGRVLDDHPLCRRCGFDLTGKPGTSALCSECGADVTRPRAIVIGHRKRRIAPLIAGTMLMCASLLMLTLSLTKVNWQPYKPVWWVLSEFDSPNLTKRDAAVRELDRRLNAGSLSDRQIAAIADAVIKYQASPSKTWIPRLGNLVEGAHALNKLSNAQWKQYVTNTLALKLDVRRRVRLGDPIPYWVSEQPHRAGMLGGLGFAYRNVQLTIGTVKVKGSFGDSGRIGGQIGGGATGSNLRLNNEQLEQLQPGDYTMTLSLDLSIADAPTHVVVNRTLTLTAPVQLMPASQPTVTLIDDPSLKPALEKSLKIVRAHLTDDHLNVNLAFDNPTVGVGFDVFARHGEREDKLSDLSVPAGSGSYGRNVNGRVPRLKGQTIDLIFRPSIAAATETTNTFAIWNGELVLQDVKVTRQTPASTRATTR
jgi:hypothetical protein